MQRLARYLSWPAIVAWTVSTGCEFGSPAPPQEFLNAPLKRQRVRVGNARVSILVPRGFERRARPDGVAWGPAERRPDRFGPLIYCQSEVKRPRKLADALVDVGGWKIVTEKRGQSFIVISQAAGKRRLTCSWWHPVGRRAAVRCGVDYWIAGLHRRPLPRYQDAVDWLARVCRSARKR